MNKLKVSIVTPVFNEESVIEPFHQRTSSVLKTLHDADAVIVYVVDKSTDNTLNILKRIAALDDFTRVIALSSRFGHQMSLLAGIENSLDSDAIIMMDSDLQHPPELIPSLLSHFKEGYDVVFTIRIDTEGIGVLRKTIGNIFYSLLNKISEIPINPNAADFRLISKRVANVLSTDFSERNLFLRGVFTWIGFSQTAVTYKAQKRGGGFLNILLPECSN